MSEVNLDALIPRDDFEVKDQSQNIGGNAATLTIMDLKEKSFFASAVRKPDFQRETNEWDSQKICGLIESFLDGDLIPAIILWRNAGSYTFVIDDLTIKILIQCKKVAQRINSNHPSSLGLHPAVYFYSQEGRHKIASFYAVTALILELEKNNLLNDFIKVRERFEEILIEYDYFIQHIVRKYRSALESYEHVKDLYIVLIKKLLEYKPKEEVIAEIIRDTKFKYLATSIDNTEMTNSKEFSKETKSAVFIKEALSAALKCKICKGYIHRNSISIDHIIRKEDGGLGTIDNAQLTHPYCNTTLKN